MLQKIALTLLLILIAWIGFKYWNRFIAGPAKRQRMQARRAPEARPAAAETPADVHDTEQCAVCGSYVAVGSARRCGRPNCPY